MQQIIISGVGGQGVLTVTRLLAEAALAEGRHVLISETHGMAQRGGNVISHLKVGAARRSNGAQNNPEGAPAPFEFTSPLIRPGRADILLALHPDGAAVHAHFLKKDGKRFCNQPDAAGRYSIDAAHIAGALGSPVSANFVLLGFALGSGELFCPAQMVEEALLRAAGAKREINLKAFHAGLQAALHIFPS